MNRSTTGAWPAPLSVLFGAMLVTSSLHAQTQRDLGSHQHGAATLDIVLDGDRLLIDLAGPSDNVFGFEHAPTTDAQRATIEDARQALAGGMLLAPDPAADCRFVDADVELPHDEEHDEEHGEEHSDIRVAWTFACAAPDALSTITTTLFERFAGFESIEVQLAGPGGQSRTVLTAQDPSIDLGAIR